MPDESISSLVDRQAQLWGVTRKDLVYQAASVIHGVLAMKDLDTCRMGDFLGIYAQKIGIKREVLERHCVDRSGPLVRPTERDAYCPICFHEDASAGYTPYFRLDWARIFLTHCRVHGCPLFRWPRVSSDGTRRLPHEWFMGEEPEAPTLPYFQQDLRLARGYTYGVRPNKLESKDMWGTVKRFEAWLYDLGVGAPNYRAIHERGGSIESTVMQRAVTLTRDATKNGRLWISDAEALSFEDQRVMSFAFKTGRPAATSPTWRNLRAGTRSIACRRAVLYRLSTSMAW